MGATGVAAPEGRGDGGSLTIWASEATSRPALPAGSCRAASCACTSSRSSSCTPARVRESAARQLACTQSNKLPDVRPPCQACLDGGLFSAGGRALAGGCIRPGQPVPWNLGGSMHGGLGVSHLPRHAAAAWPPAAASAPPRPPWWPAAGCPWPATPWPQRGAGWRPRCPPRPPCCAPPAPRRARRGPCGPSICTPGLQGGAASAAGEAGWLVCCVVVGARGGCAPGSLPPLRPTPAPVAPAQGCFWSRMTTLRSVSDSKRCAMHRPTTPLPTMATSGASAAAAEGTVRSMRARRAQRGRAGRPPLAGCLGCRCRMPLVRAPAGNTRRSSAS
jgi:hypothetical protein